MKYITSLFLVIFVTNLYSMDEEKLDHQRTPQERSLRVERINTYFKEIIEHEKTIYDYQNVLKDLEYAKKVANISLKYLDVYKEDLTLIENSLRAVQKDFSSLFFSEDVKIKKFKESIQLLRQHVYEESSSLAAEGCTSSYVGIGLPGVSESIKVQSIKFSFLSLESFLGVAKAGCSLNSHLSDLCSSREEIDGLYSSNSGKVMMIDNYLSWNNCQIENLRDKKREKIRLMRRNLDWFEVD